VEPTFFLHAKTPFSLRSAVSPQIELYFSLPSTYFFWSRKLNRIFMKRFYFIALLVVAALVSLPLFLLSPESADKRDGTVIYRLTYPADVKSLDPATCGDDMSSSIQGNFYEGLFTYHYLKRPLEVIPLLADSMPRVSDDGLVYTIRLKPGALYHRNACFGVVNGTANTRVMTSRDFVLSFKRVADYHINTGLAWAFIAGRIAGLDAYRERTRLYRIGDFSRYDLPVEGLDAPDSLTLRIRLTEPFPQFIYVLAMHVYAPIPREAVDYWLTSKNDGRGGRRELPMHERNPEIMEPAEVVGTGPYLLTEMKRKWKIRLVRNLEFRPEYYPSEGQGRTAAYPGDSALGLLADAGKRVPFIDEIHFRYVDEQYTSWMLFLSKQVDAAGIPREAFESVIRPDKELTKTWSKRHILLARFTDPSVYWIAFNMEDTVLGGCKELRQGICLGFDVESEIKVLMNGRGKRAVNMIPSDFKGHDEAGPGPYSRYDLSAARQQLSLAKKTLGDRGLLQKGEIPELKLDLSDGPTAIKQAEFIRQQFQKMGLRIKPVFNDWPTLQRKVNNKQIQMYTMGWVADYPDAENFLQLYYSGNIDKGTNNTNFHNAPFDSLYRQVRVMQDSPERTAKYAIMARILSEECPVLLLSEPESFTLFSDWGYNVKPPPIGNGFFKYRRINAEKRARAGGKS
jgi:oligopeptide transport system substrate-binding protein